MKTEATFGFLGRDEDPKLYKLEERLIEAARAVAEHRAENYGEDLWTCAYAEAQHALLDGVDRRAGLSAASHFLVQTLAQETGRSAEEDLRLVRRLAQTLNSLSAALFVRMKTSGASREVTDLLFEGKDCAEVCAARCTQVLEKTGKEVAE